jgi:hypothetical protein
MSQTECVFCNQTREKAKEHIWPKWIHEFDDAAEGGMHRSQHIGLMSNPGLIDERKQSPNSLVFGHVCKPCNNGWMSRLETDAAPSIKDVADHASDAGTWSKEQSESVATWAFKTVLMINAGSNYRRIVPKVHYRNLYNNRQPPHGVDVEVAISGELVVGREWQQSQNMMILGPEDRALEKQKHQKNCYTIGLALKHLLLRVTYWPDQTADVNPDSSMSTLYTRGEPREVNFENVPVLEGTHHLAMGIVVYS